MIGDLKDFYLSTPMQPQDYAYMWILVAMFPPDIMDHYQLHNLVYNGHAYVEIQHSMYGLPQARWLANLQLQAFLKPHSYHPCPITHGLWKHNMQPIWFTLVVDDVAICYTDKRMWNISCLPSGNTTNHGGLDGNPVLWDNVGMGLHSQNGWLIHAWLH